MFICAMSEVERVKVEGQVDVFQTIKGMRIQRPHMVETAVSVHWGGYTHVNNITCRHLCMWIYVILYNIIYHCVYIYTRIQKYATYMQTIKYM